MAQSNLSRTVEPACEKLAAEFGYELVDVELVKEGSGKYLRIYIDQPAGISLNDCEKYHHAVVPIVEEVDYDFLEVCSPGLDRPLKKQKDYDKFSGSEVEVRLYKPVNKIRQFTGILKGLEDGIVTVECAGQELRFDLKEIAQCRPVVVITEDDLNMEDSNDDNETAEEAASEEGEV